MAKKKDSDEEIKLIKLRLQDGKAVVGADCVLKGVRNGTLRKVYLASNCPSKIKEDIEHYAKLSSIPVVELSYSNEEIGVFCKKNFLISTIGLSEE